MPTSFVCFLHFVYYQIFNYLSCFLTLSIRDDLVSKERSQMWLGFYSNKNDSYKGVMNYIIWWEMSATGGTGYRAGPEALVA